MAAAQIDKCFGFDTAVEESQRALLAAKVEAASALKGIGVVKLMGRQSGFIAMQASMASGAHVWCTLLAICPVKLIQCQCSSVAIQGSVASAARPEHTLS